MSKPVWKPTPLTRVVDLPDPAGHVRDELCPHCGSTPPTWTPTRIVQAIRVWRERYGRTPSREDWARASYEHPTIKTVDRVFVSLTRATEAAGFAARTPGPEKFWTRDRIREAIQAWAQRHGGDPPTKKQWMKSSPDHPTCELVVGEWRGEGGWNGAISDAGFFPRGKWGHRYTNPDRERRVA